MIGLIIFTLNLLAAAQNVLEQRALCAMAASLIYLPTNIPGDWTCDTASQACNLPWTGVGCDDTAGPIKYIELFDYLEGTLPTDIGYLIDLTTLIMDYNYIEGTIPTEIGKLTLLEGLELYYTGLTGTIPTEIGKLTRLQFLGLAGSGFTGTIPTETGLLTNLISLDYGENYLFGNYPDELSNLVNLQYIELWLNRLNGTISSTIGGLQSASYVSLEQNMWTGTLPTEIGKLGNMTYLYLGWNKLRGPVPTEFGNCKKLVYLDLYNNDFEGQIPNELSNLPQLQTMDMSSNLFNGSIPASLGSLTKLRLLDLSSNFMTGTLPASLSGMRVLMYLYVYDNILEGTIPTTYGNMSSLRYLRLSFNSLRGTIPTWFGRSTILSDFFIDGNLFSGQIPTELGRATNLYYFQAENNRLGGTLPTQITNLTRLRYLYAHPQPRVPRSQTPLFPFGFNSLLVSDLSTNKINGTIPSEINNMKNLYLLDLGWNQFSGTLPTNIAGMTTLGSLDISFNLLSGIIPAFQLDSFINMTKLTYMDFSGNRYDPKIPAALQKKAQSVIVWKPQDVNECTAPPQSRLNRCPALSNCTDGWEPRLSYTCTCFPGYQKVGPSTPSEQTCEDINECITQSFWSTLPSRNTGAPCTSQEFCINEIGTFSCCSQGYQRDIRNESQCIDINECNNGQWSVQRSRSGADPPCALQVLCINTLGSFYCCSPGYQRDATNEALCVDINECINGDWNSLNSSNTGRPCALQTQCINKIGSFTCCPEGYERNSTNPSICADIDECTTGLWATQKSNVSGNSCSSQAVCVNTQGSFLCCPHGFMRNERNTSTCIDIDECVNGDWNTENSSNTGAPCTSQAKCLNTIGSFECCGSGYQRGSTDPTICEDIDECVTGVWNTEISNNTFAPCVSQSKCINIIGSFKCCESGYQRSSTDPTKCEDINECNNGLWGSQAAATSGEPCESQVVCINTNGSFYCCPHGYHRDPNDEKACIDINECNDGLWNTERSNNGTDAPCKQQVDCVNTNGSFYCCPNGFQRDPTNETECADINECETGLWFERLSNNTNSTCASQEVCLNTIGSFNCCPAGFKRGGRNGTECEDINECETGEWARKCPTKDVCVNTLGDFYCCDVGYVKDVNNDVCIDLDECVTGYWNTRNSKNTNAPCSSQIQCINEVGTFTCCAEGWQRDFKNGSACVDIDECLAKTHTCLRADICVNLPGTFSCCEENQTALNSQCAPCFGSIAPIPVPRNPEIPLPGLAKFLSAPVSDYGFDFLSCTDCNGLRFFTRIQYSPYCSGTSGSNELCGYACPNQTLVKTAELAVTTLKHEFEKYDFLADIVLRLFNITNLQITETKKRSASLTVAIPCNESNPDVLTLIASLARDITPNAPGLAISMSSCGVYEVASSDPGTLNLPLIIGLAVGIPLILLLLAYMTYRYLTKSKLHLLPKEVSWSFKLYEDSFPWAWEYRGNKQAGYSYKVFDPKSSEFKRALELFGRFGEYDFEITGITAVYNKILLSNFSNTYLIQKERNKTNPTIFGNKSWRDTEHGDASEWVFSKYTALIKQYAWNMGADAFIIPACHGTNTTIGEKICETGFASLSSLDAGYFGKGIYFTTYSMYCTPYIAAKKEPTIIVSWLLPGNVYPVIEKVEGPNSLLGAAIKSGFNSHFVVTDRSGKCVDRGTELFNEIIISQESQIVPAFIISIGKRALKESLKKWNRSIPGDARMRDSRNDLGVKTAGGDDESSTLGEHMTPYGFSRVSMDSRRQDDEMVYSDITIVRSPERQTALFGGNKPTYETV